MEDNVQPQSSPQPAPAEPQPQGGAAAGDFEAAVRRDTAAAAEYVQQGRIDVAAEAKKLMEDPNSLYWKGTGIEHDRAVAVVAEDMRRKFPEPTEGAASEAELSNTQRMANRGLSLPDARRMNDVKGINEDRDLTNALTYFDRENVPTAVVNELFSAFANGLAEGGGKVTEAWLDRMAHEFKGKLRGDQIALLRRWLKDEAKAVR
jgi:hypothetical protein